MLELIHVKKSCTSFLDMGNNYRSSVVALKMNLESYSRYTGQDLVNNMDSVSSKT